MANENEATRNAETAPDFDRDCFLYPLLDIFCARNNPIIVRDMSTVDIVDDIGNAARDEDVVVDVVMALLPGAKLS